MYLHCATQGYKWIAHRWWALGGGRRSRVKALSMKPCDDIARAETPTFVSKA